MRFKTTLLQVLLMDTLNLSAAIPTPTRTDLDHTSIETPDLSFRNLEGLTHNEQDRSQKSSGTPEKYFHESVFDGHYDGRFGNNPLQPEERSKHLHALVKSYFTTMDRLGAQSWIMHGTLLGWWWNRRVMPWDSDIDVQVSSATMRYLAFYYNMTVHSFEDVSILGKHPGQLANDFRGKKYLLEINPHYSNPSVKDTSNVIDARWIDTETGLFIDITSLHSPEEDPVAATLADVATGAVPPADFDPANPTAHLARKDIPRFYCKDSHSYVASEIYPLQRGSFEDTPVFIPNAYRALLADEYGSRSITNGIYRPQRYYFDKKRKEWLPFTNEMTEVDQKMAQALVYAFSNGNGERVLKTKDGTEVLPLRALYGLAEDLLQKLAEGGVDARAMKVPWELYEMGTELKG